MARIAILTAVLLSRFAAPAWPQPQPDGWKQAGVCARCHVISVVEWGISRHQQAGTDCIACHGASRGHVIDERNNVKPERRPRGAAIAALCADCHHEGCPKTKNTGTCQQCHHVHALADPAKPPSTKDERLEQLVRRAESAERHNSEGERLIKQEQWERARAEFQAALSDQPDNAVAAQRMKICERRLKPAIAGFEPSGDAWDSATGLLHEMRIAGLGIPMVLVPGGDADIGSERFAGARPVHTVHIEPFYLGKFEVTQAEWKAVMGANPSAHQGKGFPDADKMPVEQVSWEDARRFVEKLNQRVPGAGFRLPTEAEWEFAARAGEPPSGGGLAAVAWFDAPGKAPRPVGGGKPSTLGLFDMQGNVWEWCSGVYRPYPYDPSDGRESSSAGGLRVLRGGGFADPEDLLDPGARHAERPYRRLPWNGLRIVRTVPR